MLSQTGLVYFCLGVLQGLYCIVPYCIVLNCCSFFSLGAGRRAMEPLDRGAVSAIGLGRKIAWPRIAMAGKPQWRDEDNRHEAIAMERES